MLASNTIDTEPEALWLAVKLNNVAQKEALLFLRQSNGHLLVSVDDWQTQWRLKPVSTTPIFYQDQDFYDLNGIQGVSYQLNTQELSIVVQVDVSWFVASNFKIKEDDTVKPSYASGLVLNYELINIYNAQTINSNIFLDKVFFSSQGVLQNQVVGRDLDGSQREFIRLNTSFVRDDIDNITTLTIGDNTINALGLGAGLRFAGVQWGSNFTLRPKMIRTSLPTISGQALLPSTVDVYVNQAKSLTQTVPTGQFVLEDIPVISGKGEVVVRVKDMLGREQNLIVPYHVDAGLLKVGLHEFSTELGFFREQYATKNADYGALFASSFYRQGLTPRLTADIQAQWQKDLLVLRGGNVFLLPQISAIESWLAHSWQKTQGAGYAMGLGTNAQYKAINASVDWQYQDQQFRTLGLQEDSLKTKQTFRTFVGLSLKKYGSVSSQFSYNQSFFQESSQRLQVAYNLSLGKYGSLMATFGQDLAPSKQRDFQLNLSMPIFSQQSLQLSTRPSENESRVALQKSLPTGTGLGYSLAHQTGVQAQTHGSLAWQHPYGTYRLRMVENAGDYSGDFGASGAWVYLDGQGFLSRQIDNSFAVAKVGDYANVSIYSNNHLVGKTNQQGMLLVPRLLPYQANNIRINASDLPFDAEMTTQELALIPAYKSGLWATFDVKRSYAATMTILLDNGQDLPAGAEVYKNNSSEAFPVGYRGELYITGLSAKNELTAHWKGQTCRFEVEFVMVDDSLPDLGNVLCQGVQP